MDLQMSQEEANTSARYNCSNLHLVSFRNCMIEMSFFQNSKSCGERGSICSHPRE